MNRGTNSSIGCTTADISAHGRVDIGVGGPLIALKQGRGRHDLAGLAVPALRHLQLDPGALNGPSVPASKALNGTDMPALHGRYRCDARANGLSIEVHGTGATQRHAAAKFRPMQP